MKRASRPKKEDGSDLAALRQKMTELERSEAEHIQAKDLLEKERETFFPILHKAPYGVVLIDQDMKFLYINPEFTRMTGYTSEDTHAGKDWFHKASPFQGYQREIIKTWKMDVLKKCIERVLPVVCREGEVKQIQFKPTLLDDGRIIIMLSDVTEKRRVEEREVRR